MAHNSLRVESAPDHVVFTETAYAIGFGRRWPSCLASHDSAGAFDTIRLTRRGATVHLEGTDASTSPVAEPRVYMVADSAGYAPATREWPLHGRDYHHDATTSGFGDVRVATNPVGRIRVATCDTGGKLHTSEGSVAEGQRLRLAIRLP